MMPPRREVDGIARVVGEGVNVGLSNHVHILEASSELVEGCSISDVGTRWG